MSATATVVSDTVLKGVRGPLAPLVYGSLCADAHKNAAAIVHARFEVCLYMQLCQARHEVV